MRSASLLLFVSFLLCPVTLRASPRSSVEDEAREPDPSIDAEDLVGGALRERETSRGRPGAHAWVSFVGFSKTTAFGSRNTGAMLVVGFPFDRAARASIADSSKPEPRVESPHTMPAPLTKELARRAVTASWKAAGLGIDDGRLDAIVSRSRWSGLLPEARVRVIRYDDERLYADGTSDRVRDTTGANIGYEARLTWRFDRLLYADDEPAFERIRLERQDARSRIAGRVLEALFHWQRALVELRSVTPGTREEADASLRVVEGEALLDVLTGGWFGGQAAHP